MMCLARCVFSVVACIKSWLCVCTVLACTAGVYHDVPARIKSSVCVFRCCMYQELSVYILYLLASQVCINIPWLVSTAARDVTSIESSVCVAYMQS
jgi:hypothetical protein